MATAWRYQRITAHLDYLKDLASTPCGHAFYPRRKSISGTTFRLHGIDRSTAHGDFDRLVAEAKKRNIMWSSTWCSTTPPRSTSGFRSPRVAQQSEGRLVHLARRKGKQPPTTWISIFVTVPGSSIRHAAVLLPRLLQGAADLNWRNPEVRKACTTPCGSG